MNKLIKKDFAPLAPMLRNGRLKNSFYSIMRNWQVRQLHFPGTAHARRLEKCSVRRGTSDKSSRVPPLRNILS